MKVISVAVVLLVGWFTVPRIFAAQQKVQYQTAQVQRGSLISTISESGNVSAVSQTNVSSPTDGIIQEVYVQNGDLVTVGQNLFKVKSTATEQEKAAAYATYLSSINSTKSAQQNKVALQAQLEQARQSVLDAQNAVDTMNNNRNNGANNPATKQPYTQNEIDSINSALTSAKENFTATEAKYNQADSSISASSASQNSALLAYQATQDSIVTAPIDGTVANLSATVGSNVSASGAGASGSSSNSSGSSSTASTSTVVVIGNFSALNIKAQVSEVDVPKIKAGQKATITLDAFADKTFVGTVSSVDTIGTSSSGVVTFNVYITFVAPPANIQPGMSATVIIQTARKDDTLFVPSTAIQTSTDGTA
jgi:macrolide-specific efflux system membrane fusion protein